MDRFINVPILGACLRHILSVFRGVPHHFSWTNKCVSLFSWYRWSHFHPCLLGGDSRRIRFLRMERHTCSSTSEAEAVVAERRIQEAPTRITGRSSFCGIHLLAWLDCSAGYILVGSCCFRSRIWHGLYLDIHEPTQLPCGRLYDIFSFCTGNCKHLQEFARSFITLCISIHVQESRYTVGLLDFGILEPGSRSSAIPFHYLWRKASRKQQILPGAARAA